MVGAGKEWNSSSHLSGLVFADVSPCGGGGGSEICCVLSWLEGLGVIAVCSKESSHGGEKT